MPKSFCIRSKIWIEDESGEVVFGPGRMKIFEAIERLGSIHAAAKELGMGYKAIWNRIKATEERLGEALLIRNAGGASGGGSQLTPFAEMLIHRFRILEKSVTAHSDECFENEVNFLPKSC
ncbi:MAG: winged helix-turn-helix domain-containing protein [Desulfococcaceae bacterium]